MAKYEVMILQVKNGPEYRYERFASMRELDKEGKTPDFSHYDIVYHNALKNKVTDADSFLEDLFYKFNVEKPEGFKGRSMSVSDIILIKTEDVMQAYYCDSFGFKHLV